MLVGALLMVGAIGLTGYNLWTERRAEQLSNDIVDAFIDQMDEDMDEDSVPYYILDPDMDMPEIEIDGETYIGIIDMPSIGISLPVNSEFNYSNLRVSPCRYRGSAYQDHFIICAHNYRGHFGKIENLSTGDTLTFIDADGNEFVYEVALLELIEGTHVEEMVDTEYALTLFTCTLDGQSRVTIRCNKIS